MKEENGKILITEEYNPSFIDEAKQLGGKWVGGKWVFDARIRPQVAALHEKYYGTGNTHYNFTIRITEGKSFGGPELRLGGHLLASRKGRDMPVRLGPGVSVIEGKFSSSAGSTKHPRVLCRGDELLLNVLDFPIDPNTMPLDNGDWKGVIESMEVVDANPTPHDVWAEIVKALTDQTITLVEPIDGGSAIALILKSGPIFKITCRPDQFDLKPDFKPISNQ